MALPALLRRHQSHARQAARVVIGTALTYAAYRALALPQGYWAVFTVVIVLQGSIASTLGAALDRLAGTIAGAVVGGVATVLIQHGDVTTGVALAAVVGITAFAAALRPQLKVAPVTAAILLLTQPPHSPVSTFVVDRIVEIMLGGFIGVLTSVLVFPARSHPLMLTRAAGALDLMRRMLDTLAEGLRTAAPPAIGDDHLALRTALSAVEQAANDAERERASGLASGAADPAIARALWRVRNDLILVSRAIDQPLPDAVAPMIALPAAALLAAEAGYAGRCADALRSGGTSPRGDEQQFYAAFEEAFDRLRRAGTLRALDSGEAGRVFGLAFAIEVLRRDIADMGARLG